MSDHTVDVVVSGGGIAGLVTAIAFSQAGFETICVDPQPPVTSRAADGADLRTTAFLQPARNFLDDLGIWEHFAPETMPLEQDYSHHPICWHTCMLSWCQLSLCS